MSVFLGFYPNLAIQSILDVEYDGIVKIIMYLIIIQIVSSY